MSVLTEGRQLTKGCAVTVCRLLASCRPGASSGTRLAVLHKAPRDAEAEGTCGETCGETPVHWNIARHPSQIPSAINLPEKVRGAGLLACCSACGVLAFHCLSRSARPRCRSALRRAS